MVDDSPFFILGAPRSGTSLLSRIVSAHPVIGVPYETQLYRTLYPWRRSYGNLADASNREWLVDDMLSMHSLSHWTQPPSRKRILELFERHDFHGGVDALMRGWLEIQGKQRWGEKSPAHVFRWRVIIRGFPAAQVIHIVRDGRDVAVSWKKAPFGPRHYHTLARGWVDYVDACEACGKAISPERFLEIRYEDLLNDVEAVARRIAAFLGVEYSSEMTGFHRQAFHYPTDAHNSNNLSRPIIDDNFGKWKREMTPRQLRIFEAVAGGKLDRFGYERAHTDARLKPLEGGIARYVASPIQRLRGKLANRNGQIEAMRLWRVRLRLMLRSALQRR